MATTVADAGPDHPTHCMYFEAVPRTACAGGGRSRVCVISLRAVLLHEGTTRAVPATECAAGLQPPLRRRARSPASPV